MNQLSLPKLRVAIVVPAKPFFCLGGILWTQRYGPLQVASITRQAGYFVRLFNEELGLRVSPQELVHEFDVVGFSCKTSAITRAEELAQAIKREAEKLGRHVVTVLGGEHISMDGGSRIPTSFDYMLRGESEEAFLVLLEALESEKHDIIEMFQVSLKNRHICESFDNIPDLSLAVGYDETVRGFVFRYLPLIWTIKTRKLPMLTFQGSRGCPYNCSFCPTPRHLQGNRYRRRSTESALKYIQDHLARSNIRRVMFEDPTAALPFDKASHRFFETLARNPTGMTATVLVRSDICEDGRLLELMKEAGVTNLSVGIESLSDQTLSDFKKKISYNIIKKSMDIFHEHGFTITGLFIAGYDTDDLDTFERIHHFISETGIEKWRISPLSQLPESKDQFMPAHRYFLWDEFHRFGRRVADYVNGEFVIFYPKHMKPSTLQKKIMELNLSLASLPDIVKLFRKRGNLRSVFQRLGNHMAQRMMVKETAASKYFQMVQNMEGEFYIEGNGHEYLHEELLLRRYKERIRTQSREIQALKAFARARDIPHHMLQAHVGILSSQDS